MSQYPKPNPVCAACGKEMRCAKNGVVVENGSVQWRGDLFKCPKCGVEVVTSFGDGMDIETHPIPVNDRRVFADNL